MAQQTQSPSSRTPGGAAADPETPSDVGAHDAKMAWWREARFGMFIHWGVYAQWAGVYHGHRQARGGAEWIMNRAKIPVTEYLERARDFDPTDYDPDAWVQAAVGAGMRYLVVTAKHHDGIALFDSRASDRTVVRATAAGRDLLRPLADAARRRGLRFGVYYSHDQDWTNPGGSAARKEMSEGWPHPDAEEIDRYTLEHGGHWDPAQLGSSDRYHTEVGLVQVRELLTEYGQIDVLWWDTPISVTEEQAAAYRDLYRELQPNVITNDRLIRPHRWGDTVTPEQRLPAVEDLQERDYETCMTMNSSWGYKSWDQEDKPVSELIANLVGAVARGGNFLLNVGPTDEGRFPEVALERLTAVGEWMAVNSSAVYGCTRGPFRPTEDLVSTLRTVNGRTDVHVPLLRIPEAGELVLDLPTEGVVEVELLGGDRPGHAPHASGGLAVRLPESVSALSIPVLRVRDDRELPSDPVGMSDREAQTGALDA